MKKRIMSKEERERLDANLYLSEGEAKLYARGLLTAIGHDKEGVEAMLREYSKTALWNIMIAEVCDLSWKYRTALRSGVLEKRNIEGELFETFSFVSKREVDEEGGRL
jgi:hypothetical protein